jgi:hypothetical protein
MSGKIILPPVGEPGSPPHRLSEDLRGLLAEAAGRSLTIGELEEVLKGRGFALFLLIIALPFAFPISVPGLSVPFGVVIFILGLRIALGMKPSLPGVVLCRQIPYRVLEKTVKFGLKLSTWMEKFVRPRMHFLQRWPGMINLIGLAIASGGFLLFLPLPPLIPFSNTIPALSVILLTAGLMERDGLLVLLGHFLNIAGWIYFILMFTLAGHGVTKLWERFGI